MRCWLLKVTTQQNIDLVLSFAGNVTHTFGPYVLISYIARQRKTPWRHVVGGLISKRSFNRKQLIHRSVSSLSHPPGAAWKHLRMPPKSYWLLILCPQAFSTRYTPLERKQRGMMIPSLAFVTARPLARQRRKMILILVGKIACRTTRHPNAQQKFVICCVLLRSTEE